MFLMSLSTDVIIYYKEIERYPTLTSDQQTELFKKLKKGDESAREELILGNLKLVLKIVNGFINYLDHKQDLIAEGNTGLMEAVDRFDNKRGNKFSTYATFWIRQKILAYLNQKVDPIRLPTFLNIRIRKMNIIRQEFLSNFGREPDDEELCEILDIRSKSLEWTKHSMNINSLEFHQRSPLPVKESFVEPEEFECYSKNWSKNSKKKEIHYSSALKENDFEQEDIENLKKSLELLDNVEARIIYYRFFDDKTLKETALKMNVGTEWVRRIEKKALIKIKEIFLNGNCADIKQRIYRKMNKACAN